MLCLQKIEGKTYNPSLQPEKIVLKSTGFTRVGRSEKHSDVVIDSSISPLLISRLHAAIYFENGKYRIDCRGLNGMLVNKTKRSTAELCDGDEVVFGGAGVKSKEGESLLTHDSELVYVFKEVCQNDPEEPGSLGEGTSDGRVLRRSKRKQPVSTSEELRYMQTWCKIRGRGYRVNHSHGTPMLPPGFFTGHRSRSQATRYCCPNQQLKASHKQTGVKANCKQVKTSEKAICKQAAMRACKHVTCDL